MSDVKERIDALVKANDVLLFMKGSTLFPQCGFSSRAVAILDHLGVPFETVDILQDQEIRTGITEYSDWPTIPQLYVKGEFVGEAPFPGRLHHQIGAQRRYRGGQDSVGQADVEHGRQRDRIARRQPDIVAAPHKFISHIQQ